MKDNIKIGFYGHSTCSAINTPNDESYIDQIRKKYSATIVNVGVRQGSEERILYDLKKTKELDIAIIFHSHPRYIFLPKCSRDIMITHTPEKKSFYFWNEFTGEQIDKVEFEHQIFKYGKIKEVFETPENYINAITAFKEYFYTPDLAMNRFQSSLFMIDDYVFNKKIPVFHSINYKIIPPSFKFKSGEIDYIGCVLPYINFYNNISQEHNNLLAKMISKFIDSIN